MTTAYVVRLILARCPELTLGDLADLDKEVAELVMAVTDELAARVDGLREIAEAAARERDDPVPV
jgi:hypothetical protein